MDRRDATRCFLNIFLLTSLLLPHTCLVNSRNTVDDCSRCIDPLGRSCDELMRRFGNSRYWLMKGGRGTSVTFDDALSICNKFGFTIAEIGSEGDQATFAQLAKYAGSEQYWIGAVSPVPGVWTLADMITPLSYQPPRIQAMGDEPGGPDLIMVASIDANGEWRASPGSQRYAAVCQTPTSRNCGGGGGNEILQARMDQVGTLAQSGTVCPTPKYKTTRFVPTGPNSKYLYPEDIVFVQPGEVEKICLSVALESATFETTQDIKHIHTFIKGKELDKVQTIVSVSAGLSDAKSETAFININTRQSATLQIFPLTHHHYYEDNFDCIGLISLSFTIYHKSHFCQKSLTPVVPICQYRSNHICFTESPLAIYARELKDDVFRIGATQKRTYFGGWIQKTYPDAKSFCQSKGMQLLSLLKNDTGETVDISNVIVPAYVSAIGIPMYAGKTWTSGVFRTRYDTNQNFMFEATGETWSYSDNKDHFSWIKDSVIVNRDEERCLVYVGKPRDVVLRPVVCHLKNYFICHKDNPISTTTTTTTTTSTMKPPAMSSKPGTGNGARCKGDPVTITFPEDGIPVSELIELIEDSIKFNFSTGYSDGMNIKEGSQWRIPHVKAMGAITKKFCPSAHVTEEYINILMNIIMIYYNSVEEREREMPNSDALWKLMGRTYDKCENATVPLTYYANAGLITEFTCSEGMNLTLDRHQEMADSVPALDYILEGLWHMFQVTAGVCYSTVTSKTTWLSEYFYYFRMDFTEQFRKQWVDPGDTNFGLVFGDLDLFTSLFNLRACALAAFQDIHIRDRMMVRPVRLSESMFVWQDINQRVE